MIEKYAASDRARREKMLRYILYSAQRDFRQTDVLLWHRHVRLSLLVTRQTAAAGINHGDSVKRSADNIVGQGPCRKRKGEEKHGKGKVGKKYHITG